MYHKGSDRAKFVSNKKTAMVLGMIMHSMAGVVFALVYAFLWSLGLGSATWWWGVIFGAVDGVIAMVMIPILMRMLPRQPEMAGGPMVMVGQLMGHLVYGLVVALVYAAF